VDFINITKQRLVHILDFFDLLVQNNFDLHHQVYWLPVVKKKELVRKMEKNGLPITGFKHGLDVIHFSLHIIRSTPRR
jgi:hypothetical protein